MKSLSKNLKFPWRPSDAPEMDRCGATGVWLNAVYAQNEVPCDFAKCGRHFERHNLDNMDLFLNMV